MYKRVWTPISEVLQYVVCLLKDGKVVRHLKEGSSGRFEKTIFYFLRSDTYAKCCVKIPGVKITGKPVNLADGEGMQVPCILEFEGKGRYIDVVNQNL